MSIINNMSNQNSVQNEAKRSKARRVAHKPCHHFFGRLCQQMQLVTLGHESQYFKAGTKRRVLEDASLTAALFQDAYVGA